MAEHTISPAGDPFYAAARRTDQDQDDQPHACIAGVVYIGHMVEGEDGEVEGEDGEVEGEDGEEGEDYIAVPCKRCQQERRTHLERTTESRGNLRG